MLTILLWMLVATLVTGVLVGWLAEMSLREIGVQLLAMAAVCGVMIGLVGLLYAGS